MVKVRDDLIVHITIEYIFTFLRLIIAATDKKKKKTNIILTLKSTKNNQEPISWATVFNKECLFG